MIGPWRFGREAAVGTAWLLLLGALAAFAPSFFRPGNLRDLLVANAPTLVAAVGMTVVVLARHVDVSIGSQFSICGVVAGLLAQAGAPLPIVALGALGTGAAFGLVNGQLVARWGLPSIVATLATMAIGRETLRWAREGEFVRGLPSTFQWFGAEQSWGQAIVLGTALAVFLAVAWGLRNLTMGRWAYATGSSPESARLVGARPDRVVAWAFVLMGTLSGLAGLLSAVRFSRVDPNDGNGLELQVIAAVVVGGTSINGGRGTLLGTLLGVGLLGTIGPALVYFGARPEWEKAAQGAIVLLAVASDAFARRRGE